MPRGDTSLCVSPAAWSCIKRATVGSQFGSAHARARRRRRCVSRAACSCIARATVGSRSGSAHARGGHRSSESHAFLRPGGPGFKARSRCGSSEFLPRRRFRTACAISARSWELRFRRAARSSPRRCGDVDPRRVSKRTQPSTVPRGHVLIATYLSADGELEIPTIVAEPQDLDLRYRAAWMEERSVLDRTLRVVVVLLGRGAPGRVRPEKTFRGVPVAVWQPLGKRPRGVACWNPLAPVPSGFPSTVREPSRNARQPARPLVRAPVPGRALGVRNPGPGQS